MLPCVTYSLTLFGWFWNGGFQNVPYFCVFVKCTIQDGPKVDVLLIAFLYVYGWNFGRVLTNTGSFLMKLILLSPLGVNEISLPNFCVLWKRGFILHSYPTHISNCKQNFKCSNFTPEALNNLSITSEKPYCGAINYFYDVIEYICRESPCFAHSREGSPLCINVL